MSDVYEFARSRAAALIEKWSSGTITLTRSALADPEPSTPWTPGAPTTTTYALRGRVDGVIADYVDDTTIVGTDRMAIVSPKAVLDGAVVDIEPRMSDVLEIDGKAVVIKMIKAVPASGAAALFHIVIAS